jgi:hypothetical protein
MPGYTRLSMLTRSAVRSFISPAMLPAGVVALGFIGCAGAGATGSTGAGGASSSASGAGGAASACAPCVSDGDCPKAAHCAQFAGDTYCAADCSGGKGCGAARTCTPVAGFDGSQVQACLPADGVCGGSVASTAGPASASASSAATGGGEVCGSLHGPDSESCCTGCKTAGQPCQMNGCFGGWWCNADTCKCQLSPGPCGGTTSSSAGSSSSSTGSGGGGSGVTGISGGALDTLSFAIVGDTRPPTIDDTAGYPKAVIQKIWQDIEAASPRPAFGVTTGDYMFAKPFGNQSAPQIAAYLAARANFSNVVFPAMGNHECTGGTASNCGPAGADGVTNNYTTFLSKLLAPYGVTQPYYTVNVAATNNAWTAKFVFVAANAWSAAQGTWLAGELAKPTTYTFVIRHEDKVVTQTPGVTPSQQIIDQHPLTLLVVGHTHTFTYYKNEHTIIVGNGGAPLTGAVNYGYVIARQRADGAIELKEYDYSTNAVSQTFAVKADGTPAP